MTAQDFVVLVGSALMASAVLIWANLIVWHRRQHKRPSREQLKNRIAYLERELNEAKNPF